MKRNKKALFLIAISFVVTALYAKSNKTVEKYVHPRNYTLDLTDSETKAAMVFDGESLTMELVFSEVLKDDLPKAGDRIKIAFSGYTQKSMGQLSAQLYDRTANSDTKGDYSYKLVSDGEPEILCDNVKGGKSFKGLNYFILTDDVDSALCIRITANYVDNPKKLNKSTIKFARVTKTVNTTRELEALNEAEKKGYEIVEITSDFSKYEDDEEDYDDYEDDGVYEVTDED